MNMVKLLRNLITLFLKLKRKSQNLPYNRLNKCLRKNKTSSVINQLSTKVLKERASTCQTLIITEAVALTAKTSIKLINLNSKMFRRQLRILKFKKINSKIKILANLEDRRVSMIEVIFLLPTRIL